MSRAISVDGPSGPLRVISVEDVVAHEARLLLDLDACVPVPAKHADDYLRLTELVKIVQHGNCVQDHRKPTHPMRFGEADTLLKGLIATRRNLLISLEYSKETAEICPRCVRTSPFQLADPNVVLSLLGIASQFDVESPCRAHPLSGLLLDHGLYGSHSGQKSPWGKRRVTTPVPVRTLLEARFWTTSGLPTTRPNGTHLTQAAPARRTKNFTCEIVLSSEFRKR